MRELNARANRLAHHLRALGVGPDERVGALRGAHGLEMVVALLGVLKAAARTCRWIRPIRRERLRFMLADSAPVVLLDAASGMRELSRRMRRRSSDVRSR